VRKRLLSLGQKPGFSKKPDFSSFSRRQALKLVLGDVALFSRAVLGVTLRPYQLRPLRAILASALKQQGLSFLLIFPRQSGKNELVAVLQVYLLNLFQRRGGRLVFAATGDGLGRGLARLEARLDNPLNRGRWRKGARPLRRSLGRAVVVFISAHPAAAARGETADRLLVIDELQEHDAGHIEAVFEPMRAAANATAVYLGTVKSIHDALWGKKLALEALERADGRRRVFLVGPEEVTAANPAYAAFLAEKVARLGRQHPVVRAEYFNEPLDGAGGLFPPRRRALMEGDHPRLAGPEADQAAVYVATLDVAGQDEAATGDLARPGRDYTVATVFAVEVSEAAGQPLYRAVDVFVDQGSRHFESGPGKPALAERLLAWLTHWRVGHLVADSSGVGAGLVGWLAARLRPLGCRVTGYEFAGRGRKAALGVRFLAVVETGRFKYWAGKQAGGDAWWFFCQAEHCAYELPPGGVMERELRWFVPEGLTVALPQGGRAAVHDDRLVSAALVAVCDELFSSGRLRLGGGESAVIDPLERPEWGAY
jgi:hypothetical protein